MTTAYSAINAGALITLLLVSSAISIALGGIAWSRISALFLPFPTSLGALSTFYPLLPFLAAFLANAVNAQFQQYRQRGSNSKDPQITHTVAAGENGARRTASTSLATLNNGIVSLKRRSERSIVQNVVSFFTDFVAEQVLTVLPVVIATLAATYFSPGDNGCRLEQTWQSYFHNKNVNKIRTIQDQLQCCGLRSTRDRAWPFRDANHGNDACEKLTGYTQSCLQPWGDQNKRVAVLVFVAAILGWSIQMGLHHVRSERFYAWVNHRDRRNAWNSQTEREEEEEEDDDDQVGPRLSPFSDTVVESAESNEGAEEVSTANGPADERPLLSSDARDLPPEARAFAGASPWREDV